MNPALKDFGTQSEARQYAGRAVPPDWRCPFHPDLEADDARDLEAGAPDCP